MVSELRNRFGNKINNDVFDGPSVRCAYPAVNCSIILRKIARKARLLSLAASRYGAFALAYGIMESPKPSRLHLTVDDYTERRVAGEHYGQEDFSIFIDKPES